MNFSFMNEEKKLSISRVVHHSLPYDPSEKLIADLENKTNVVHCKFEENFLN